jgi:hypothetical protein
MPTYNQIYDQRYFDNYARTTTGLWWSSVSRYAIENSADDSGNTSEVLEIDLGRRRLFNYVCFDILRKPLDVTIQYDSVELNSLDLYPSSYHRWKDVEKLEDKYDMHFENHITYGDSSSWQQAEFYFKPVYAQRIRLVFTRTNAGDGHWPANSESKFPYTVDINNLRIMRYILDSFTDVVGPIIEIDHYDQNAPIIEMTSEIGELRQRFTLPANFGRNSYATTDLGNIDGFSPTDLYPNMLGFGVFVEFENISGSTDISWELYDLTYGENLLGKGMKSVTNSAIDFVDVSPFFGQWINIYFDNKIETNEISKYELRLRSSNKSVLKQFYTATPIQEDSDNDLYYQNGAETIREPNRVLTYRIFGDVGHSGKDLLGNEYREGLRINKAKNVLDKKPYSFWTSLPNPSPNGVEALYLDVRSSSGKPSIIDGFDINVITPGVMMNVYYSVTGAGGAAPTNVTDWENIIWKPIQQSYVLNKKEEITFPTIRANFLCLEFYNLQPYIINFPEFPFLPPVKYKEFPAWVVEQSLRDQTTSFINTGTQIVSVPFYQPFDVGGRGVSDIPPNIPLQPDAYSRYVAVGHGSVDPLVAGQISIGGHSYISAPQSNVNLNSLSGQNIQQGYNSSLSSGSVQIENTPTISNVQTREVSNLNNRDAYTRAPSRALMFNRSCAHLYDEFLGHFNKKGYTVSISEISVFRKDFTTRSNDEFIRDILADDILENSPLIELNNWIKKDDSRIPNGQNLYVSYIVGDIEYLDEQIRFENPESVPSFAPIVLQKGGVLATNIRVHSEPEFNGMQYIRDYDYVLTFNSETNMNTIGRNSLHFRLVVENTQLVSNDRKTIIGYGYPFTENEGARFALKPMSNTINGSATVSGDVFTPLKGRITTAGATIYAIPPTT